MFHGITVICWKSQTADDLVWCLFGVHFYSALERTAGTAENKEKTHNDQC